MIGLTLPLVADAYFGPILSGAAEALYERDMRIVLAPTLHEHDRESVPPRAPDARDDGRRDPDAPGGVRRRAAGMLQRQGFPFVVVDPREAPPEGIACVSAMHAAGAKQATEHLLELGHRRIGAIAGAPNAVAGNNTKNPRPCWHDRSKGSHEEWGGRHLAQSDDPGRS